MPGLRVPIPREYRAGAEGARPQQLFTSYRHAREISDDWRTNYNLNGLHTSLDGLTPHGFTTRSEKDRNANRANLKRGPGRMLPRTGLRRAMSSEQSFESRRKNPSQANKPSRNYTSNLPQSQDLIWRRWDGLGALDADL
jgi:hypothetical protein